VNLFLISCGGDNKEIAGKTSSAQFLPAQLESSSIFRDGETKTYIGESLYEYINGGAELYHLYNFVEVSTGTYISGEAEIVADIYQFDMSDNAYGLYTLMRPEYADVVKLGVEGFGSPTSVDFVKDKYLVRLTGYDESSETFSGIRILAAELEKLIPGTNEYPKIYSVFPDFNKISHTDKQNVESYMGHSFLSNVYTQDYQFNEETATLFMTEDKDGTKFIEWETIDKTLKSVGESRVYDSFDDGKVFQRAGGFYGDIIAGLKKDKLVGIINYKNYHEQFLIDWLESMD